MKEMNFETFKIKVMEEAQNANIEKYEIYYASNEDIMLETYQKEVSSFAVSESGGVNFRCIINGKAGYSATELFNEETAKNLIRSAMDNALMIECEDPIILKEKGDTYQNCKMKSMSEEITPAKMQELAIDVETSFYEQSEKVTDGSQVYVSFFRSQQALCNSEGLDLKGDVQCGYLWGLPIVAEGQERYDGEKLFIGDISTVNPKEIAEKAVLDGLSKIGGDTIESRKYACVFSGKVMAIMLETFSSVFCADSAQKGISLLKGKEGEMIASPIVTLIDDPFYEESFIQTSFDGEGAATFKKNVIEQGVFKTFLHNLTTAAKASTVTTGNAARVGYASPIEIMPYNFYIQPGSQSRKELFEKVGDGIYITELNGVHAGASPITGDFSLSAEGFLIEKGQQTKYIKNFTVSDNFYNILKGIECVGNDLHMGFPKSYSVYGSPSVLIQEISVAGK